MLVKRPGEEAVQQFVIVDGLGDESPHEFEVTQVVGVDVRVRIDHVSDSISGGRPEQRVVGVENVARYDAVPLAEQASRVLALLPLEHDVETRLPVLRGASV